MADKEKKKSTGKKLITFLGVVLFIAIVVIVIILLVPKNNGDVISQLCTAKETTLLQVAKEKSDFADFKNKVTSNSRVNGYESEIDFVDSVASNVNKIMVYYNDYLPYIEKNKTFNEASKAIRNNLSNAQKQEDAMADLLANSSLITESSDTYLRNTWIKYRSYFSSWLDSYNKIFVELEKCYTNCLGQSIVNNSASQRYLKTINDYMSVLNSETVRLVENDTTTSEISKYQFTLAGKSNAFTSFVSIVNNNVYINSYYNSTNLQQNFASIEEFLSLSNQSDLTEVISSIDKSGNITKTYENQSSFNSQYDVVKTFLKGGSLS